MRFFVAIAFFASLLAFTSAVPTPDDGGQSSLFPICAMKYLMITPLTEFVDPDSTQQDAPHWFWDEQLTVSRQPSHGPALTDRSKFGSTLRLKEEHIFNSRIYCALFNANMIPWAAPMVTSWDDTSCQWELCWHCFNCKRLAAALPSVPDYLKISWENGRRKKGLGFIHDRGSLFKHGMHTYDQGDITFHDYAECLDSLTIPFQYLSASWQPCSKFWCMTPDRCLHIHWLSFQFMRPAVILGQVSGMDRDPVYQISSLPCIWRLIHWRTIKRI